MGKIMLQEMTTQEMRETNGGCFIVKLFFKFFLGWGCCNPCKPGGGENPGGGQPGENPGEN